MSGDNARINKLRLELQRADAIYSSEETHGLMERVLGEVWDMAVLAYQNDKTLATKFLLGEHPMFEGKRLFDIAVSGDTGHQMVYDHIGRSMAGVHC